MNSIVDWLQLPAIQRLGWTLLHFLWQGTIIAWVAAMVLALLRNRSAAARYVAACGAMLLLGAAPAVTFFLVQAEPAALMATAPAAAKGSLVPAKSRDALPDLAAVGGSSAAVAEATSVAMDTTPPQSITAPSAPEPSRLDRLLRSLAPFLSWMVAAWLLGVLALSIRLAGGWIVTQRLRRLGTPATGDVLETLSKLLDRAGVRQPVRLLVSAAAGVPSMVGWWKPVILLPLAVLTDLSPRQLEAILAHELAHIRRHDYLVNLLQCVLETLLFYHPAVWWISARIRRERENACDDLAVQWSGDRLTVARALTAIEELRGPAMPLALAARDGVLLERIKRLLGQPPRRSGGAIMPLLIVAFLIVGGLLGIHTALQAAEPQPKPAATAPATRPAAQLDHAALIRERDRLLADAGKKFRAGILALAEKYPQLRKAAIGSVKMDSLKTALAGASDPGTIFIQVNWPPMNKAGPMQEIPEAERYDITVLIREPPNEAVAAMLTSLCSQLNLVGQVGMQIGDTKLAAEVGKLMDDALAPLLALDRAQPQQPNRHPPQVPKAEADRVEKAKLDLEQPVMEAWGKLEQIDHPLLAGIKDVGFDAVSDKVGLHSLGARFIRNADWKPKAAGPTAEDPAKPYVWIQVSLWRKDVPSQPPPAARPYRLDPNYTLLVVVKSSDAELQKRVETLFAGL